MKKAVSVLGVLVLFLGLVLMPAGLAQAQSGNTWHVEYYPNLDWAGNPVYVQDVPWLSFNWGYSAPGPNMPADNWSLRATTYAFFYAGVYRFALQADDEVVLKIDGTTWLDTRGQGMSGKSLAIDVNMWQGTHYVEVLFREYTELAYLYVNWTYLGSSGGGAPPTPAPGPSPYPPLPTSASSVVTQYGDYTPCIQQNSHQSNCFVSDGQWNSPNLGSIQMEPQITVWGQCVADQKATYSVPPTNEPKEYNCSKTMAGWFPY